MDEIVLNIEENNDEITLFLSTPDSVPFGGTSGQILSKNSNNDFDVKWIDPPASEVAIPQYRIPFGSDLNVLNTSANIRYQGNTFIVERNDIGASISVVNDSYNKGGASPIMASDGSGRTLGIGFSSSATAYVYTPMAGLYIHGYGLYGTFFEAGNVTVPNKLSVGAIGYEGDISGTLSGVHFQVTGNARITGNLLMSGLHINGGIIYSANESTFVSLSSGEMSVGAYATISNYVSGAIRNYTSAVTTDMGVRLDVKGWRMGPNSTIGDANTKMFELPFLTFDTLVSDQTILQVGGTYNGINRAGQIQIANYNNTAWMNIQHGYFTRSVGGGYTFTVNGGANLAFSINADGTVNFSSFVGLADRLLASNSTGDVSASIGVIDSDFTDSTDITNVENSLNWTSLAYTGPALVHVKKGQVHYGPTHKYEAFNDNSVVRTKLD